MNSPLTCLTVTRYQPNIVVIELDQPGSAANVLNETLFAELDQTMEQLAARADLDGVILYSNKPSIFIAGADLKNIAANLDWPDEQIIKFCEQGRAVMARFSRCPFVTVAAIHGAAVGGGLELALWCDYRIASDDRRTQLGLPEVKLGLVPGWAGTARLPRMIGFRPAAELLLSGDLVSANVAKKLGFIDEVVLSGDLLSAAASMIGRVKTSESFIQSRKSIMGPVVNAGTGSDDWEAAAQELGDRIVSNEAIFPYAPLVLLEHLARTAPLDQPAAWKSESLAMAQVWGTPANRGLLNHFFLVDHNKKNPGLVDLKRPTQPIQSVGIVGAGLMGRSIAQNCLGRGMSVVILDAVKPLAATVANELREKIPENSTATINATEDYNDFRSVDLVLESVVETFDVKAEVLKKISVAVGPQTIIASNTSAIPISKLASVIESPERFCGIHFCHPELMSLVEIVCGNATSESTIATSVGFVRSVRKMAVAMNDGPGFVVNRLLAAMLDQSLRILSTGVSIETIDQALREFGFLGGPFEIIDVIGADTCMYAGRTMWETGLKCVSLSPILPRLVKRKRLGRKTGRGFYHYPDPRGEAISDPELASIIGDYQASPAGPTTHDSESVLSAEKITEQILSVMVLEASRILDEEIVADYRDLDLCVIEGFSFPKHRGGILFWADSIGLETIYQTLLTLSQSEPKLEPSLLLKSMRQEQRLFYGQPSDASLGSK